MRTLILSSVFLAAPLFASNLEDVVTAYNTLAYDDCIDAAEDALDERAAREERIDTYRYQGLCYAALGETDDARGAFIAMLAIDPDAKLPPGLSPRFTSAFLEARGHWYGKTAMKLTVVDERDDGGQRVLTLAVDDKADMVRKVAWREVGGALSRKYRAAERMELRLPEGVDAEVVGLDAGGGEVVVLALARPKPAEEVVEIPPAAKEEGGGLVIGLAVVGGVVGLVAAGGVAAALLMPPTRAKLVGGVVFGDE